MTSKLSSAEVFSSLSTQAEKKQDLCASFSQKYRPKGEIKLLIVGESPPIGGSYFYIPEDLTKKHQGFPAKIFRGLFSASTKTDNNQCKAYLVEFQNHSFFLTDLVSFPIDCFTSTIRATIIESQFDSFLERLESLTLAAGCKKVLILPSGTLKIIKTKKYKHLLDSLNTFGFSIYKMERNRRLSY